MSTAPLIITTQVHAAPSWLHNETVSIFCGLFVVVGAVTCSCFDSLWASLPIMRQFCGESLKNRVGRGRVCVEGGGGPSVNRVKDAAVLVEETTDERKLYPMSRFGFSSSIIQNLQTVLGLYDRQSGGPTAPT